MALITLWILSIASIAGISTAGAMYSAATEGPPYVPPPAHRSAGSQQPPGKAVHPGAAPWGLMVDYQPGETALGVSPNPLLSWIVPHCGTHSVQCSS
jgi:hypothetical protein